MPWNVVNYLSVAHDFWWGLVKSRELKARDCTSGGKSKLVVPRLTDEIYG
jgi:hypothetical protein